METLIAVDNNYYTVDFLLNAVKHYKEFLSTANIPSLNDDIWKEIMLKSTSNTLKTLCLTHKVCYKIYINMNFWIDKFAHDSLPPLIVMKRYKVGKHKIHVPSSMRKLPEINKYVLAYNKMFSYHAVARKFANNMMIAKKKCKLSVSWFQVDIEYIDTSLWLPQIMIKYIMNDLDNRSILAFGYKEKKFYMQLNKDVEESEERLEKNKPLKMYISKQEFIYYFTLMLYYESDYEYFDIGDVLRVDDLLRGTKKIKSIFPKWI